MLTKGKYKNSCLEINAKGGNDRNSKEGYTYFGSRSKLDSSDKENMNFVCYGNLWYIESE